MTKPPVAVLGVGIMGAGMAHRLLGAGYPLTVYNRNAEKTKPLAAAGAKIATTPSPAAVGAEFILSMVSDDSAARAVWLGENGALAGAKPGAIFIESSTVSPGWIREFHEAAAQRGCFVLDAPVTGTKPHAASGELTFLVGGDVGALEKARPVLAAMSKAIFHFGPSGSGALIKLLNNFMCAVQACSFAEALAVVEKSGLDRALSLEILAQGTPGSPLVKAMATRMTVRDYTPNFMMRLMVKDVTYAAAEGKKHGVDLRTAVCALDVFKVALAQNCGEKDFSAVVEQFR